MEQMERGKQWAFSCYSPAKDCVSIPGLDDVSPEELRLEAYQVTGANVMIPIFTLLSIFGKNICKIIKTRFSTLLKMLSFCNFWAKMAFF
jgi:hypothetical protein